MGYVLTEGSTITCAKKGSVVVTATGKLKVEGNTVLVVNGIDKMAIKDCGASSKPCTSVSSATGAATKLKVGGEGAALDTLVGTTDGEDAALAPAEAKQTKLKGI